MRLSPEKSGLFNRHLPTQQHKERFERDWRNLEIKISDIAERLSVSTTTAGKFARYMGLPGRKELAAEWNPTPDEITEATKRIRAGWTPAERARRLNDNFKNPRVRVVNLRQNLNEKCVNNGGMRELPLPPEWRPARPNDVEEEAAATRKNDRGESDAGRPVFGMEALQDARVPLLPKGAA